jgi:hypothetical protein
MYIKCNITDPEAFKEISQNQADAQKTISDMTSLSNLFTKAQHQQQQGRR